MFIPKWLPTEFLDPQDMGGAMSAGAIETQQKGPTVWLAIAGLILCVVGSAGLILILVQHGSFRSVLAIANLLPGSSTRQVAALSGAFPRGQVQHGVRGATARDAVERPPVPGWDPVVHLPAADLADLNPDQIVDRALGQVPDDAASAAAPTLATGRFTVINAAPDAPPHAAPAATAGPVAAPEVGATKTAEIIPAEHAPTHQILPPPPNVHPSSVFAIELAFFLDADAASSFAVALGRNGIATRLVEQLDEAGRNWIYVRSPVFTDSVAALAYAETLEQKFGLPALLVSEPPATPQPAPAAPGK